MDRGFSKPDYSQKHMKTVNLKELEKQINFSPISDLENIYKDHRQSNPVSTCSRLKYNLQEQSSLENPFAQG